MNFTTRTKLALMAFALIVSSNAWSQDFGAEAELHLPLPLQNATDDGGRLNVRSFEATAQAKLDDDVGDIDGKLTLGAEDHTGDLVLNIREAFLNGNLGAGFSLRGGKFYLPIGLLNQTRKSSWAFIAPPRAIQLFFGDFGVVDSGVDIAYENEHLALRAGATSGFRFDDSVKNGGNKPRTPTNFARPEFNLVLGETRFALAGDYLGRVNEVGDVLRISGVDFSFAPQAGLAPFSWDGQLEFYHRYQNIASQGLAVSEELGGYLFTEKGVSERSVVGLRLDAYQIPTLTDPNGQNRRNFTYAVTPIYTLRRSDHLRFQAEYTYSKDTRVGDATRVEQIVELRLVTEFGDLPTVRTPTLGRSSL